MNPSEEHLLEQLEQATARGANSDIPMDEETAELRQGWLYLARLLNETDELVDEAEPAPRATLLQRREVWITVACRALAAGLLIAITATWLVVRSPVPSDSPPTLSLGSPPSSVAVAAEPSLDDELAWSDQLDEQLDAVSQTLIAIQSTWRADDPLLNHLQERLDRMEEEMQEGAL